MTTKTIKFNKMLTTKLTNYIHYTYIFIDFFSEMQNYKLNIYFLYKTYVSLSAF